MEVGKLPSDLLDKYIFKKAELNSVKRKEVRVRPSIGEDCAVLDMGQELLILSTDPITGACENIGKLLVNINANDIYSNGCEPVGLLITLLLPPDFNEAELSRLSEDIFSETEKAGLEVLGGHTEITDAVNRPVVSATVVGKSVNRKFIKTGGAKPGQDVIMTKYAALEGTSVLAADNEEKLLRLLPKTVIEKAKSLSDFLSVKTEGLIASEYGAAAMHDVTEGGILGACYEIAEGSGLGIEVYADRIPILEETKTICRLFGVNPLRLISSGSMVIAAYEGEKLAAALEKAGIKAAIIGKMTEEKDKCIIYKDKKEVLSEPEPDQIYSARLK
ncbi:MAG: AIR synthase family protein [Clostridiales bacterium]|nr:AIR synthase family protein [Clostridiales bacterium]